MEKNPEQETKTLREMTLVGHLSELRRRIVISVLAIVVGTIIAYVYIDEPGGRILRFFETGGFRREHAVAADYFVANMGFCGSGINFR